MISLQSIVDKVTNKRRLSPEDALYLFDSPDIIQIGELANQVNYEKNKDHVYYNLNRHINPTNICVMSCKFCAFAKKPRDKGAYAYSLDDILKKAQQAVDEGATEVHMVGGLHPRWSLNYYLEILNELKKTFPSLHLKGFTAVEIDWLAKKSRFSLEQVLSKLKESGLDSLPGGGAEIFAPQLREKITAKLSSEEWLTIHRTAHNMGLKSNCTMLYGHIETKSDRVYHLTKLRELQDDTKGFNAFIPLSFQPHHNDMNINRYTYGLDDLKTIAVSRLYLDNFSHIKAYWVMLGQDIAQLATSFGANDIDGTIVEEKISHAAGGRSGVALAKTSLQQLLYKADRIPIERDSLYVPLQRKDTLSQHKQSIDKSTRPLISDSLDHLTSWAEQTSFYKLMQLSQTTIKHYKLTDKKSISLSLNIEYTAKESISNILFMVEKTLKKHSFVLQANPILKLHLTKEIYGGSQTTWLHLTKLIQSLTKTYPKYTITLSGLSSFYSHINLNLPIEDGVKQLSECGITLIEETGDAYKNCTFTNHLEIHKRIHQQDMPSIMSIYLNESWNQFITQLKSVSALQHKTNGLIGINLHAEKNKNITIYEYVKAVALTRILCTTIPNLSCSLTSIPSKRGKLTLDNIQLLPQEKTFPLCLLAGANDLHDVYLHDLDDKILPIFIDNLVSTQANCYIRDNRFNYNKLLSYGMTQ